MQRISRNEKFWTQRRQFDQTPARSGETGLLPEGREEGYNATWRDMLYGVVL